MKTLFQFVLFTFLFTFQLIAKEQASPSPVSLLHLSVLSCYTHFELEELGQSQAQSRLESIFQDKLAFVEKHDVRKLLVKVLDPSRYPFFEPSHFSQDREDNFFYFLTRLLESTEVEIVFDETPFTFEDSVTKATFRIELEKAEGFYDMEHKLNYFNRLISDERFPAKAFSIKDMVIAPIASLSQASLQAVINNFDRYRFSPLCSFSPSHVGIAMVLEITDKEMALANLASFPLHNDIRVEAKSLEIGFDLPQRFPSSAPHYPFPSWRQQASMSDRSLPLLSYVYLNLGSQKLAKELYHDRQVLPLPSQYTPKALPKLATRLQHIFTAYPYTQGPGYLLAGRDQVNLKGRYTFFKAGSKEGYGQLIKGQKIGVYREDSSEMLVRQVASKPQSNTTIELTAPLSFDNDLNYHPYYYSPFPVNWSAPCLSRFITTRLFYLFDVNYMPGASMVQGNWHLVNFLHFLVNAREKTGFLYTELFTSFEGLPLGPSNNLVIGDYSGIPNGEPYEEINWHLDNGSFKD